MEVLLSKLAAQIEMIRAAPLPFILAVIAATCIVWLVFAYAYSTTLASKDSQIALWKDRAQDWEKSGAGTPEEVKRMLVRRWPPSPKRNRLALFKRCATLSPMKQYW
jgi:hypothetical protein